MRNTTSPKNRKRVILHARSIVCKMAIDLKIDPKDCDYVLSRLNNEGISFLTKTLPIFSKFALRCCDEGAIPKSKHVMSNFAWKRSSPDFLSGLLFDAISGSANALYRIRQFCDYFYKTVFSFTERDLTLAQEKYLEIDKSYDSEKIDWGMVDRGRKAFETLFPKLCTTTAQTVFGKNRPHDGPGEMAQSELIKAKYKCTSSVFKKLPIETIGSHRKELNAYSGYFKAYPSSREVLKSITENRTADIRFVPKDSRGPRTISKEPYFALKAQMSFQDFLSTSLTSESRGRINFADQTVNQRLSESSSLDRQKATLDLQEASDRLWSLVVRRIGRNCPIIRFAFSKLRSESVRLQNGDIHRLNKFANMGSGLCFPILSLVTYIAAVIGVNDCCGGSLIKSAEQVYVYGDDLIVPTKAFEAVTKSLVAFGLLVNTNKSYAKGFFRESCGADFYHGVSVTPVRLRLAGAELGTVKGCRNGFLPVTNDSGLLQLERHARELVSTGLTETASYIYDVIENKTGKLPIVHMNSKALGRVSLALQPDYVASKLRVPIVRKSFSLDACGIKGLGNSFKSRNGLGEDFCLTPLRRDVCFKRMVLGPSETQMYGLTEDPSLIASDLRLAHLLSYAKNNCVKATFR